jgi:hypothetical protein
VWRHAAGAPAATLPPAPATDGTEIRFAAAGLPPAGRGSAARAVVVAVLGASLLCSLWTLREAVVGVDAHAQELRTLAAAAPPGRMLVLDNSDWIAWNLYGADVWRPPLLYAVHTAPIRGLKGWRGGDPYDLDSVSPTVLNRFSTVLTARNAAGSTPPPGLRVLHQTRSFVLWQRTGTVPAHRTLAEGSEPGAVLDCSTPSGARIARRRGTALIRPLPVIGRAEDWTGTARDPGTSAWQTLRLPAGSWDLSMQYVSRRPLDVSTGSLHTTLPANLDRLGPLFDLGTTRGGTVRVTVRQQALGGLARALGARGRTRALDSLHNQPLGTIIATRHGVAPVRVPLAQACGRYVDWYTLG